MRTPPEIEAEIKQVQDRERALQAELAISTKARHDAICSAFDGGGEIAEIAEAFDLGRAFVRNVLARSGRSKRKRASQDMTSRQKAAFEKLCREGINYTIARKAALAVTA